MKKVGLVTCYFKSNYGSLLQAYATQKFLDSLKIENETINIDKNIDFKKGKRKYYTSQIFNFTFVKSKLGMIKLKFDKKINKELGKNISIREKKFKEFRNQFRLTKELNTYAELKEYCKNFDNVLVGSDQLWLPVNVVSDYYTLNWVPDEINKISFSTSFGISSIPEKYEELYKKFLNRINYLSTREESGKKIIKDLTDRDAKVVCDPTLLFNKEEWMDIQEKEAIIKEKYILCYFLGNSIEYRKFAERLKEKTGYKIISINHCDEYVKYSDVFADETPYDIGPAEFLNLIRNSEYVCTDSFHGTVFSLINNVKFFVFRRYNKKSKVSTNSRLDSLLETVNLKERLLEGNENIDKTIEMNIDFSNVNKKLEEFRSDSKEFLEKALNRG
ncbi:MAG TPA: polysaccharide pyruvyl transferase family protein [Candidatus Scatovivens faecipullorum]|nr:polysaccharide pyruvyl transferase family protein [Candidatus Scatovivens faecipullorum]